MAEVRFQQYWGLFLKKAGELLNRLDSAKFPLLLQRIVQKLHLKDERAFTDDEEGKLHSTFKLDTDELELVLETTEFFLQQAAYHNAKPAVLTQQLQSLGLNEDKVADIVDTWTSNGKDVIENLRKKTLNPKQLDTIKWRLNLQMAQSTRSELKEPNAAFELGIRDHNTKETEKLQMEFTHEELYAFYSQLEQIQSQLDTLS
ncbi:PREDICTED: COMM domain-containing protein 10-like [Priapulus caudatus]|uniref:COMM domain-containing protein 10-like n=1 Tax=Priapulus caudatus TaxID=37621 RepID=A0ABM1EMC3_PRICU|nr:PREDICTED: COMM domain-containing protein 10-like [Priapulus caudatus]